MHQIQHFNIVMSRRLRQAMDRRYPQMANDSQKIAKLAKESGVGRVTIQRILDPQQHGAHATRVDSLDKLAKTLRVELPWMLTDLD